MDTATADVHHAIYLLNHGSSYETAIRILRAAVVRDPHSSNYRRLLACALADRAASIADAAHRIDAYKEYRRIYVSDTDTWRALQNGKKIKVDMPGGVSDRSKLPPLLLMLGDALEVHVQRFGLGSPPPAEPVLRTVDDKRSFKLTLDVAKVSFLTLCEEALDDFKRADALSTNAADRAETSEDEGWAQLLILRNCKLLDLEAPCDRYMVLTCLQTAVDLKPQSALYLRAKADAIIETAEEFVEPSSPDAQQSIALYHNALNLDTHDNAHVSAQVLKILQNGHVYMLPTGAQGKAALADAMRVDPQNAYLMYLQACLLMKEAHTADPTNPLATSAGKDALLALEAGNAATHFSPLSYEDAVPAPQIAAWCYDTDSTSDVDCTFPLINLSSDLSKQAVIRLNFGENELAHEVLLALVAMGQKIEAAQPTDTSAWTSENREMESGVRAIIEHSYAGLVKYHESLGDADSTRRVKAESLEFDTLSRRRTMEICAELYCGYPGE